MKLFKRCLKILKVICDHNGLYYKNFNYLLTDLYSIFCKINKNYRKQLNDNMLFYSKKCLINTSKRNFSFLIFRLYKYQYTNIYIYIMACYYLDKINKKIQINKFNFQTIFLVLIQLSDKYYNDFYYSNARVSYIMDINSLHYFKKLELELFKLLDYNMYFTINDFKKYENFFLLLLEKQYYKY